VGTAVARANTPKDVCFLALEFSNPRIKNKSSLPFKYHLPHPVNVSKTRIQRNGPFLGQTEYFYDQCLFGSPSCQLISSLLIALRRPLRNLTSRRLSRQETLQVL
jgi:hypothetical protein